MKKRNLVLCLASLCGATALICGTLLSNGNVFSLSSTVANYDLKIDNQNIEINGTHASIKAADATYNLNLDVNGTLTKKEGYNWGFIRTVWSSIGKTSIALMQDFLNLNNEARMNTPSTLGGNWQWRMKDDVLTDRLANRIYHLTKTYGRCK